MITTKEMFHFIQWMNEKYPPNHPVERAKNQSRYIAQIPAIGDKEMTWINPAEFSSLDPVFYTIKEIWEIYKKTV